MESLKPEVGTHDNVKISCLEHNKEKRLTSLRCYYNLFSPPQKHRFTRLVRLWGKKLGIITNLGRNGDTIEILLLKQIALNTIRIEEVETGIRTNQIPKYGNEDNYALDCQKERREAIKLLITILHTKKKKKSATSLDDVRNILRKDKGLDSTETELDPDMHDRKIRTDVDLTLRVAPDLE
jgi:hypothetical protein